jgi:bifunctional non-homologous end joining protein LigD
MPPKPPPKKPGDAALEPYRRIRDFEKTPEPAPVRAGSKAGRSFVIQEHHARSHHFDFRIEMNGVLVSWAVPKGIPEDRSAKRLAVHVEDHPLEYGEFEGVIPKGSYGAGTVAIWDKGTWEPIESNWKKSFAGGKLRFALNGERLSGVYLLARMGDEPNWLIRKLEDELPPSTDGKAMREKAAFVSPQLARVVPTMPAGSQWLHEIKYDGYRLVAVQRNQRVRLYTRNEIDWTNRFAGLASQLATLTSRDFVIDGEAVVFDEKGRSRFGELQAALQTGNGGKVAFVAFDLLHYDGLNFRQLPLETRVKHLASVVGKETGAIRLSKVWPADQGRELFKQACSNGLEGVISKNAKGRYLEGERRDWVKSKCRARQEFVVCGYTEPKGSLEGFGALVLGTYENGKLIPRGKVGTGFSDAGRKKLLARFKPLCTEERHFLIKDAAVTWLEPKLVAEIEFAEITRDGSIRQGSFIALREDKVPTDVHLDGLQSTSPDGKNLSIHGIHISHPDRLVYPGDSVSKLEVARHYARVGEWMLPYVANRPLAVLRAPDGITGQTFFQKSFATHTPPHVLHKELRGGSKVFYVKDINGLVALAQFGAVEFHPWGCRMDRPERPDLLIWDLDPDPAVPWPEVLGAALLLRDYLEGEGLTTVVKTSGGKGLHIMLYLKRTHEWPIIREFTKAVAQVIATHNPKRFIVTSTKSKRSGKIFIDWMRNGRGSTCIAPWSLRARPGAAVSMPVNWSHLPEITANGFTIRESLEPPSDWAGLKPQTLTRAFLKRLDL